MRGLRNNGFKTDALTNAMKFRCTNCKGFIGYFAGGVGGGERILSNFNDYDGYYCLCHKRGLLSKERICSSWSRFVLLKIISLIYFIVSEIDKLQNFVRQYVILS